MTSPKQVLKSIGPKLVPFFKTVAIYFVLFIPGDNPSWFAMVIKLLPIVSLIVFVLLHGMSLGDEFAYSRRILLGLIFCAVGDALLIWHSYFLYGMVAFAVGHIMYISAFGFRPLNPILGSVVGLMYIITTGVLLRDLEGPLRVMVPLYSIILMVMVWRAVARVQLFEELWTWTKLCSCAGGILFAMSDFLIGLDNCRGHITYQAVIMLTYYAAQLGIALSVVDSKASYERDLKSTSHHLRPRRAIPLH